MKRGDLDNKPGTVFRYVGKLRGQCFYIDELKCRNEWKASRSRADNVEKTFEIEVVWDPDIGPEWGEVCP